MNCTECKEKLVELLENLLPDSEKQAVQTHLGSCAQCRAELNGLKELTGRIASDRQKIQSADLETKVLAQIICEQNKRLKQTGKINRRLEIWRKIMHSKITKFSTAAIIIFAAIISVSVFNRTIPVASANQVLQEAVDAVSDLWSVHMKTRMRTLPNDNFSLIGLEFDFVPIEMWKRTDGNELVQWRVEKPGRVLLMDGKKTIMLIRPNTGVLQEKPLPLGCFDSWSARLLKVHDLLNNELQKAKDNPDREICLWHKEIEGQDKIILEVEVAANVSEGDYLRNSFITSSDHLKVYQFDSKTKLLESFKVYVHTEDKDILVFEVTDIEYNVEIDNSVFVLELPENMNWYEKPKKLSDNEKYEKMTPKEAATAFFQACADENWDEAAKFWPRSQIEDSLKKSLGGLKIVSIGEPFQSEGYANGKGWFVPYEIEYKPVEGAITLSKDNAAERFVITEGKNMMMGFKGQWSQAPEVLPDNDYYAKLSASEVVIAYYEALSRFDYAQMKNFMPVDDVSQFEKMINQALSMKIKAEDIKAMMPVVEIVSTQFSEDGKTAIVNISQTGIKKFNLAIRKDNPAKRYVVDGGI